MPFARIAAVTLITVSLVNGIAAQSGADQSAIVATSKDYIEGWYAGDAARMARALHPELVKRIQGYDSTAKRWWIDNQGASRLIGGTARGGGTRSPKEKQRGDVKVLDVFGRAAVVRIDAGDWVDFLQLVKEGDRWLILNVLWELRT
jgi:hypothetical protein